MPKYKMKFFGMITGNKSGKDYSVSKDQIVEAPEGEFNEVDAELIKEEKPKSKKGK